MKQYIILAVSILCIIILNVYQINYLCDTSRYILTDINDIQNSLERKDSKAVKEGIDNLEDTWKKIKNGWDIFGEHDDVEKINEHIASIKVYYEYDEKTDLVNEICVLERLITHVVEAEKLDFGNVL